MSAVRTLSGTIRIGTSLTSPTSTLTTASISLISGSVRFVGNVTGTIPGTSSQAINSATASFAPNYLLISATSSLNVATASLALTASLAPNYLLIASTASMLQPYVLTSVTASMLQPYVLTSTTSSMSVATASFASSVGVLNQNVTVTGNLTVNGTASFTYTTASQVDIGNNIILLNSSDMARFAGISVFDSGSTASTASLFWDSDKHKWIYQTIEGLGYNGGMFISGPRNTGSLGDEVGTTTNALMKGQGGDHITSSAIIENGTSTTFYSGTSINATSVTSSTFLGNLTGTASVATTAADSQLLDGLDSAQFAQLAAQNLYTEINIFRNVTYYQADSYNVVQTAIVPTLGTNSDTIDVFNIYSFIEYNSLDETRNYSAIFTYNISDISSGKTVRGGQVIMVWSPDRDEFKTLVDTNAVVYGGDITFDIIDDYTLGSEYVKLTMTNNSGGNVYVRGLLTIT
jgi:hypothetical protein